MLVSPVQLPDNDPKQGFGGLWYKDVGQSKRLSYLMSGERVFTGRENNLAENGLLVGVRQIADRTQDTFWRNYFKGIGYADLQEGETWFTHIVRTTLERVAKNSPLDIPYWTRRFDEGDPMVEKLFGREVFLLLATRFTYGRKADSTLPQKFIVRPSYQEFADWGYSKSDILKAEQMVPTLIGKTAVFTGITDEYSGFMEEQLTFIRRGSGLSNGKFVVPGGHSEGLLDVASVRELLEEIDRVWLKTENDLFGADILNEKKLRYIGYSQVIDQILITPAGLKRYLIDVFRIDLKMRQSIEYYFYTTQPKKYADGMLANSGDDKAMWQVVGIDHNAKQFYDSSLWPQITPIDRIILENSL